MVSTSKILGSIEREVRTLSTAMDECATHLVAMHPDAGLTVRKTPDRVVLQAKDVGVSVSLFRSRAGAEASAEVVLAVWQGEVTFPGSTPPREGYRAKQVSTQQFHIVPRDDTSWAWMDETTTDIMTSRALATTCIETLAAQL